MHFCTIPYGKQLLSKIVFAIVKISVVLIRFNCKKNSQLKEKLLIPNRSEMFLA